MDHLFIICSAFTHRNVEMLTDTIIHVHLNEHVYVI